MKSVQTVVFLGDSITLGYGLENQTERFSSVFCRMTNTIEINYGATGTLMARAGISTADGSSFIDRYPMMEDGDLVIVFGGTNDYFWTDAPISGDVCEDDRYFENAVHHLCSGLKEKYAGKPIVFILPYKMRGIGNYFGGENSLAHNGHNTDQKNYVGHTLIEYVNMQKSICLSYGIYALDLYTELGADMAYCDSDELRYTLDGCHPNIEGHRYIANLLYQFCIDNGLFGNKSL